MGKKKIYPQIQLTRHQYSALIGSTLGDLCIRIGKGSYEAGGSYAHGLKQEEYLNHKFDLFKPLSGSKGLKKGGLHKKTKKYYPNYWASMKQHPILTDIYKKAYINGVKVITDELLEDFDEISLAYLFMDDGSFQKSGYYISLCAFDTNSITRFVKFINTKFGIKLSVHNNNQLYVKAQYKIIFTRLIEKYILPSLRYKLHL
jgi:hypothetical protein